MTRRGLRGVPAWKLERWIRDYEAQPEAHAWPISMIVRHLDIRRTQRGNELTRKVAKALSDGRRHPWRRYAQR